MHITMYKKAFFFLAGTGGRKTSTVACGINPINNNFSDCSKSLISQINEIYVFLGIYIRIVSLVNRYRATMTYCLWHWQSRRCITNNGEKI